MYNKLIYISQKTHALMYYYNYYFINYSFITEIYLFVYNTHKIHSILNNGAMITRKRFLAGTWFSKSNEYFNETLSSFC